NLLSWRAARPAFVRMRLRKPCVLALSRGFGWLARFPLVARLRGDESDGDREFVRALARSAGLEFRCGAADVRAFARSRKISVEMAARECRRSFFTESATELNAGKIALGHT